jgi:hypothetical protein
VDPSPWVHLRLFEEDIMTESTETVTIPAVLTRREVAQHCRISTRTVLRMCQDGRLKGRPAILVDGLDNPALSTATSA